MIKTIKVSKNGIDQILNTEYLINNDIIIKKNSKGKDFEITLHRFSNDEILELRKSVETLYAQISKEQNKSKDFSIKEIFEKFFK